MASESTLADSIAASIQGPVSGQVAVGKYIVQIGSVHGGVVNLAGPEQQPHVQARPAPVFLRPRAFRDLLDRRMEVDAANAALQSALPVEFHGSAGLGKTTLLRHLAYHPLAGAFVDGVVYLSTRRQPLADLLQSLWDAFYESATPFKPTDTQIRHDLQNKKALVLLDDVELARDEVETLIDAAPGCAFILASPERRLWGEGHVVALRGLPLDDALALVERELGRPLTREERPAAQALYTALDGRPLHLLQAAALVREEHRSLADVARQAQTPLSAEALSAQVLAPLSKSEQSVLGTLAVLEGAPLSTEHLAAVTGLADAASVLETLQRRGLVQSHFSSYSLTVTPGPAMLKEWDVTLWTKRIVDHFTSWVEQRKQTPGRLLEESGAILQTVDVALRAGRLKEALRLVRAVDGALALGRRWGAWAGMLRRALEAARALRDRAAEAWVLHQSGTRAMCVGDVVTARTDLIRALRLRQALGDTEGAKVTWHNLRLLLPPPSEPRPKPRPAPLDPVMLLILAGAAAILLLLLGWLPGRLRPVPTIIPPTILTQVPEVVMPPVTITLTDTPTPTPSITPTGTPSITPTPTPTPCSPLTDWPIYFVQEGDTLFSIARATGASVDALKLANCLAGDVIIRGQPFRVPRIPVAEVSFAANPTSITGGECAALRWESRFVTAVQLDGEAVAQNGSRQVCPASTTTYRLRAPAQSGDVDREVAVTVSPPVPKPLEPGGLNNPINRYPCTPIVLRWEVPDPGAIQSYGVNLQEYNPGSGQWEHVSGSSIITPNTTEDVTRRLSTRSYRWNVWAIDKTGARSKESAWLYFECLSPIR